MSFRQYRLPVALLLVGLLVIMTVLAIAIGAMSVPPLEVVSIVYHPLSGQESTHVASDVIWKLRIPRTLLGLLTGATLGVSGAIMQGLFRNPLADPALVGVSSGAALGAVFILVLGSYLFPHVAWVANQSLLPVAAIAGAGGITWLIHKAATVQGKTVVATLLLAGIAINALAGAMIGLATFLATDSQLRSLAFWTMGSLGGASWKLLGYTAIPCLAVLLISPRLANALNAYALGESEAGHLGVPVEKLKRTIILLTAIGVGSCVAFTGMIGFLSLVVPHLIRLMLGPDHRWLIPLSAVLGGILMIIADTCARTLAAPAEIPIGILTAAFGAPFFLWLLLSQRKNFVIQ